MQTQTAKPRTTGTVRVAKVWQHKTITGYRASAYGAHPATGVKGNMYSDWEMVTTGWTVAWPDGTVGCMRMPFATEAEAQDYVDAHPRFPGWNQG